MRLKTETKYPLAREGVFLTVQGEGSMLGVPMVFVRLGGCSVGCPECDTDYGVASRAPVDEIVAMANSAKGNAHWAWITGGEPLDHDIAPLINGLWSLGLRVAAATSGTRPVQQGSVWGGLDYLYVSPHDLGRWKQRAGTDLNVVPGLNGLRLGDWEKDLLEAAPRFTNRFVTPCAGKPETVQECLDWVYKHQGWRMGTQAHKQWGVA